jgi:hypothetical protein
MKQLSRVEAIEFFESEVWKDMSHRQIAGFQLFQELLCLPINIFMEALSKELGRPVFTHELSQPGLLRSEFLGSLPSPTLQQIIDSLPNDKTIIVKE